MCQLAAMFLTTWRFAVFSGGPELLEAIKAPKAKEARALADGLIAYLALKKSGTSAPAAIASWCVRNG